MIKNITLIFLSWRIFLFIPLIAGNAFITYRQGYPYTSPLHFLSDPNWLISNFLFSPWANFDGVHYLLIAANGYTQDSGFFPLFPLLIFFLTSIISPSAAIYPFHPLQYVAVLFAANLLFGFALIMLYKLIKLDYQDSLPILVIIFILIFPTSFFFASIYSESLFLLLSVLSFYFARTNRWFLATLSGGLLTATRFVGIAIIPALVFEFIKQEKSVFKLKGLLLLLMPLGILGYMLFNFLKWGAPFYFIQAQGSFHNEISVDSIVFIPQTIFRYIKILTTLSPSIFEWWIALLEISVFAFVSIMTYLAWKKKVRFSYIVFAIICFLIPISSGTFTGLPRYALVLFPIFITLAMIKSKLIKISYGVICFILLFILFMLFSRGYYIA